MAVTFGRHASASAVTRLCLALLMATLGLGNSAAAQIRDPEPAALPPREPGSEFTVYLMTMGPGNYIWENFGHNAILIQDRSNNTEIAYNYGIFDFDQENFYGRLIRGDMLYSMMPFDGLRMAESYARDHRSVWLQELNLTPAERLELREFLEWNALEANRDYSYDYFRDNCSTRVRDAIDRVLDGALRMRLEAVPTGSTYRSHSIRLTADDAPAAATGLLLAFGPSTDVPLNAWEESFIPMKLSEHVRQVQIRRPDGETEPLVLSERMLYDAARPPARQTPPDATLAFLLVGVVLGAALALLGRAAARTNWRARAYRFGFATVALAWTLVAGTFGTVIAFLWIATSHTWTYGNENLFQVNPLVLALGVILPFAIVGRARTAALAIAIAVAALSTFGFLLQALPGVDQQNGGIIALALPANLGLLVGLWLALGSDQRHTAAPTPATQERSA